MQFLFKSWLQSSVSDWLLVSQCQDHELVCNAVRLCLELCAKGSLIFKYAQTNFKILPCKMKLEASCGGPIYCMFGNKSHSFAFKPVIFWSLQYLTVLKTKHKKKIYGTLPPFLWSFTHKKHNISPRLLCLFSFSTHPLFPIPCP